MDVMFAETTDTQMDKDFGKFGQKFQLATLSLLIQDKAFANKIKLIIKSEYFDNKYNQFICETILTFIDNYHCQPDFETLKTIIETQVGTGTKLYLLALNSIKDVDLTRKEFVEAECAKFCFTRHALSSLEEERAAIMNGKFDKAREVAFQKYKPLNNASSEVDLKKDYTKALSSASRSPVPTPLPSMNMVSKGGPGAGDLCIIVAQSNFGKCFAKGTEVLMQDLSIRKVEDIKTNDKVMGWDGKPRTITSLAQGQEEMYEIKQDDGTSYTVNESHILVLKPTKHYLKNYSKMSESLVKIEVKDYIKKSATWRKNHKGIKVGVDNLSSQTVLIDPYYLGLWLGDGSSANQSITNKDEEVVSYLKEYAEELLLTLSSKNYDVKKNYEDYHSIVSKQGLSNVLLDNLRIYGLLNNKHIPFAYLNNDRQARLELLAGLLDSDGYLNKQTKTNFEISQINYTLAADIAFLARSLGFKVREREVTTSLKSYDYKGKAIKLLISGDTHLIPTKIARKQAIKRKTNKRHDCLTISVVSKGLGNYYGFTISDNDPDKMFLLKDFTVVHNTNYLVATAKHAAQLGKKVLFFSLETDNIQLMQRILAGIVNVNQESLSDHPTLIESKIKAFAGELKFIEMKSIHARVDAIKAIVEEKKSEGFFPDMIIVDGLNQVKPPRHERFANANDKFEYLAEELRDMAKELRLPVYAAFQSNRGGFNVAMADEQNIGKAIEVYQVCDWMLLFTQTLPMQDAGECYVQLLKNRLGPKGLMLKLRYNPGRVTFEELESVNRSLLLDESKREGVAKGLDTMKARLDAYRKKSGT